MANDLLVTGLGVACAGGEGVARFTESLRAGESGVAPVGEEDGLMLECARIGPLAPPRVEPVLPGDGERLERLLAAWQRADRCGRATLYAAAEAWFQAGCTAAPARIALVVAGSNLNDREVEMQVESRRLGRRARPSHAAQFLDSHLVGLLGEIFGIAGEGYTAGGASASGGVALALARRALQAGDVDAVLVVAPPTAPSMCELEAFAAIGALRRTRERPYQPFQKNCAGFVFGEGAGAMMIEAASRAGGRGVARLRAAVMGLTPSRSTSADQDGEVAAMRSALAQAGCSARDVDAVNAHATGTAQGDAAEARAIADVFLGQSAPVITATKAVTGHCLCSAGLIEAIASVVQLTAGFAPPNPFLTDPVDQTLRFAGQEPADMPMRSILSNSFGFGGIQTSQIFAHAEGSNRG